MPAPEALVDVIDSQWPRSGDREETIAQIVSDLTKKQIVADPHGTLTGVFEAAWPALPPPGSPVDWSNRPGRSDIVRAVADHVHRSGLSWTAPRAQG